MRTSDEPIVVEQTFDVPAAVVWRAITDAEEMRQWFFDNIPEFEPAVGFETRFNVRAGGRDFLHLWTITEVVPVRRIMYDWKYAGYDGDSTVTFELFARGAETSLKVTAVVMEDFPDDIPEFTREAGVEGWTYFIQKRLEVFLSRP